VGVVGLGMSVRASRRVIALSIATVACATQQGQVAHGQITPTAPPSIAMPDAAAPSSYSPALISDEACIAGGNRVVTRVFQRNYRSPWREGEPDERTDRVCLRPSDGRKTCSSAGDCFSGRCRCTGDLARPEPENSPALQKLDGTRATGVCMDEAESLLPGTWWCLVQDGTIHLQGIIID
jgi:hypothetical protein